MPVNVNRYEQLLKLSHFDPAKTEFLVKSFRSGFPLCYGGPTDVKMKSPNLKLRIGTETDLWNKVMKEVKLQRFVGPFEEIPFDNYIQSPIGLVPKDGDKDTRLIFHLSYPRKTGKSVNANIPKHLCSVKYPDFCEAISMCLKSGISCNLGKSDMKSAFRNLGMKIQDIKWLVMKVRNPLDGKWYYFIDKCLLFGSSISCAHFQLFSDSITAIVKFIAHG